MTTPTTTATDSTAVTPPATAGTTSRPRRRRRTVDSFLRPVQPIKAIWTAASEEERQKARALAAELLGYWLGHETKADLSRRLGIPPIRVWQMSQRALSGMVTALLRPPEGRRGAAPRLPPEVKELRARVAELEAETSSQRRLIELFRTLPGPTPLDLPQEESRAKEPRRVRTTPPRARRAASARAEALPRTPPQPG